MMLQRQQAHKLRSLVESFPVVSIVGPRQAGKTTMARSTFPEYRYVSLEDLDNRAYATEDPRGFLAEYSGRTIIDEVQRVPDLFSYMQTKVDEFDTPGQYILTGSAHLILLEQLTQSLAGRAAILKLLPLSVAELREGGQLKEGLEAQLFAGFYPRLYKHHLAPVDWYTSYIQTYLEKDVREILNIKDLQLFRRFIGLCAGRHGQILEVTALANDCGISRQTAGYWLAALEASFLIHLLPPYYKNFNKRLTKSPKLYFYDTGLVCALLGIEDMAQLHQHHHRGAIFEGYVITEIIKQRYNRGLVPQVYFWREKNGHEVDCIVEYQSQLRAVEIKSGKTVNQDFFKGLEYWQKLVNGAPNSNYLIYGGDASQQRSVASVLPWDQVDEIFGD